MVDGKSSWLSSPGSYFKERIPEGGAMPEKVRRCKTHIDERLH